MHSKSQNYNENCRIRTRLADPVVAYCEKKHVPSLCKIKSALIYTRIAKPLILPLQLFDELRKCIRNHATAASIAASEQDWRIPSSPIVEELLTSSYIPTLMEKDMSI